MASTCIIKRDNKKNITSVKTRSGERSTLYDKIASIPLMENRERALSVFKTVYSSKFIKAFGNWLLNTPVNKKAYNKIKENIDKVPEKYRSVVLERASKMDNPLMISKVNSQYNIEEDGFSFYSESLDGDVFLVDAMVPSSISATESADNLAESISMDFTPVINIQSEAGNYVVVKNGLKVFGMEELASEESDGSSSGVLYKSGEPRLFFMNDSGKLFEDYGEALISGGSEIQMGFLSGTVQETGSPESGVADILHTPDGYILNNRNSFIPLMTASTSTSVRTPGGAVNYLIKKGLLSGSKIYDPETGSYYLTGAGFSGNIRLFNSAISYTNLCNLFGSSNVEMNDRGMIRIKNIDKKNVTARTADGKTVKVSKEQIKEDLKSGRYSELDSKYDHFDALVLSLILEDNDLYSESRASFISDYHQEELKQRNAIVEILKSLGVRVVGMSDYIEKYKTKHGHEPSAKALADIANNVIAVGEGATLSDVIEETAHFLVEAYRDQNEINDTLEGVEQTEEWKMYAGRYYDVYGKTYEGAELDEAVRREILGKILAGELGLELTGGEQFRVRPAGFMERLRNLISGIVNWIRGSVTTQKADLDTVVKNIRDLALADMDKGFDTSLLKDNNFTLYSLSDIKKNEALSGYVNKLKTILRDLRQINSDRSATVSMTLAQLKTIEDKINSVEDNISKNEMAASMNSMIATAEAQMRYMRGVVDKILGDNSKDGKLHFSAVDRQNVDIINKEVRPLMEELRGFIRNRTSEFSDAEKKDYTERIDKVVADISGIQSDIKSVEDLDSTNFFDKLMNELHIPSDKAKKIREYYDKVQKDVSWLSRWFGILENSSSVHNGTLGALIARDNYNAMVAAQPIISRFLADVKKNGWSKSKFERLLKTVDGKTSRYLKSAINYAKFENELKKEQLRALKQVFNLEDLTDEKIDELVRNNKSYQFEREVQDQNGNTKKAKSTFKPSADRVNLDIMNVAQEKEFSDIMRGWIEENTEQPFTESYKKRLEDIYNEAEKILGRPVSEETKEYLGSLSRQKRILRSRFYGDNNEFDFIAYAESSEREEVGLLAKQKKEAASEYVYVGNRRVKKEGKQLEMAKEIQAVNEAWVQKMKKESPSMVSGEFLSSLRKIQSERGGEAAFKYVTEGGHFSFSDTFWKKMGYDQASRTESNNNASYKEMADAIKNSTMGNDEVIDKILQEMEEDRATIKEVIGNNRDSSNIGEVNTATFTAGEMESFRKASERIEQNYAVLIDMAKMAGLDVDDYLSKSEEAENRNNQAYFNDRDDSGMPEWEFAAKHTTLRKARRIADFRRKIENGYDNRHNFSVSETNFLAEQLGIGKNLDKKKFREKVNYYVETYSENGGPVSPEELINRFARGQVFSYYKRMEPTGYSDMLQKIKDGRIDIPQMIEDIQNGTSTQDYGMDISYLKFDPNRAWVEEESAENSGRNPAYKKDHGYGRYLPKKDLYEDKEYIDEFGIIYDENGNEIATRNIEDWKMIGQLTDIMKDSLSRYKESGRNIYSIPQISKSDIERLSDPRMSAVRNFVADLCLDRVDDSLYGATQMGETRDPEDRPRIMPKYYINELENLDDVAHDLAYSYSMLMMQSSLYNEKQKTVELAMGLEQMLLNKQFANGKTASSTNAYNMFRDFMNDHYFGIRMNTKKLTVNIGGYNIDVTRIMMAFERFMSTMNLALSPFVAATGALTGQVNLMMEAAVGQYISKDSLKFANAELSRLAPSYINEIGDIDRKNKLYVIGERLGVFGIRNRMYGAGFNRVARTLLRSPLYSMMEVANAPLDPQVMIAVLDNTRFDGIRFYTFQEFKRMKEKSMDAKSIKREWDSMKDRTLWNMIDVKDGNVTVNPATGLSVEDVENQLAMSRNQVRSLAQICNGSLNEENRTAATRNWMARFMTAHRGWLVLAAQRLWKSRGFNFQTMQEEEGLCITLKDMINNTFEMTSEKGISGFLKAWKENKGKMDDTQKTNIKRMAVYAGTFAIMEAMSMLLSGWRDDDENEESWITQFGTYVGFRTINEIASQMPLIMEMNVVDIINDPFVMGRKLSDLADLSNYSLNKVTSGAYEGDTKLFRLLAKMTFLKQWYNISTPKDIARASRWWQQTNKKSMMFFIGAGTKRDEAGVGDYNFDNYISPTE